MAVVFNDEQIELLQRLIPLMDVTGPLSDAQLLQIEDAASNHLQRCGFDEAYNVTEEGRLCEEILDLLSDE